MTVTTVVHTAVRPALNHSRLFEELLLELQVLINSDDAYDLVKSSRVLRQLLLDGDALLHLVNRELRAPAEFNVLASTVPSGDDRSFEIHPSDPADTVVTLNLQKFLAHTVGWLQGESITVKDVIKFGAIVLGGVHFKAEPRDEHPHLMAIHESSPADALSPVHIALKQIGAVTRDALIPIRNRLLMRERFEGGSGWTALLSLRLFPAPADEENYILDIGTHEHENRFSVYVDTRGELTFRLVDAAGTREYLRAGRVGHAIPFAAPIIVLCEMSTIGDESLLSIRTDGWDHAQVVPGRALDRVGVPFHVVLGSDCLGKKHTHMDMFGTLLIGSPLSSLDVTQTIASFSSSVSDARHCVSFSGNQFLHSDSHPNFASRGEWQAVATGNATK